MLLLPRQCLPVCILSFLQLLRRDWSPILSHAISGQKGPCFSFSRYIRRSVSSISIEDTQKNRNLESNSAGLFLLDLVMVCTLELGVAPLAGYSYTLLTTEELHCKRQRRALFSVLRCKDGDSGLLKIVSQGNKIRPTTASCTDGRNSCLAVDMSWGAWCGLGE